MLNTDTQAENIVTLLEAVYKFSLTVERRDTLIEILKVELDFAKQQGALEEQDRNKNSN